MLSSLSKVILLTVVIALMASSCQSDNKSSNKANENYLMKNRNKELCNEIKIVVLKKDISKEWGCEFSDPVLHFYQKREFLPFWSDTGKEKNYALSFINYLDTCEYDGIIKNDFSYSGIKSLWSNLVMDSLRQQHPKNWAKLDVLLTNALFNVCNDLKRGRLYADSLLWKYDTSKFSSFFDKMATDFAKSRNLNSFFISLQPKLHDYKLLRNQIQSFVKNMDTTQYFLVDYSLLKKNETDSLAFYNSLFRRFYQESLIDSFHAFKTYPDSLLLSNTIKLWQKKHGVNADGLLTFDLIKSVNLTDNYKYLQLMLTLDRYKKLSDSLGDYFIIVNLPAYQLKFWDADTLAMYSKIICGKQSTPTPQLQSAVNEIITMPTWTVPPGIVKKEMLPQLKKNPGYLSKKGLSLYDNNGRKLNPGSIDWSKYHSGIPYKITQRSGIRNALGVIKFNFKNDHYVYLHDTNERSLFQRDKRCLSHGCVRVEKWMELANTIARKDSILTGKSALMKYNSDSIANCIENKKNRRLEITHPIPLFISYFSVESINGQLVFHKDIYGDDEKLIRKYYSKWKLWN
jgi:murein L,D-transpeptidase YcbB/YkuD